MIHCVPCRGTDEVKVTFTVSPDGLDWHTVAVVGDFNHWDPTAHPLMQRIADGVLHRTLTLPVGRRYRFRYVTETGCWFDDDGADGYEENEMGGKNSVLDLTGPFAEF